VGRVGVLGTPATVATGAYAAAIAAMDPFVEVVSVPCGDLATRIEGGTIDHELVEAVRGYCAPLRAAQVDTVILGCTHYPLVRPIIQRMLGPGVPIITSGAPLARQVEHVLGTRGLDTPARGEGDYRFLCTGDGAAFREQGTRFLQLPLGPVELVSLTDVAAEPVGARR
jgi:glutamate racemase